jgi:hypothetical protein
MLNGTDSPQVAGQGAIRSATRETVCFDFSKSRSVQCRKATARLPQGRITAAGQMIEDQHPKIAKAADISKRRKILVAAFIGLHVPLTLTLAASVMQ